MQKPERKDIWFDSADKKNRVSGYIYENKSVPPFCAVQISHGMCEYMARYEGFASFLTQHGVAVCGNDHLGHGNTAAHKDDLGYFTEQGGRNHAVQDLKTMNTLAHRAFPGLPVILLGHSMGSFFARKYAALYPESIAGLILSGTGGPNPLAGVGIALADSIGRMKGPRHRSATVHNLAFGAYNKQIQAPKTPFDWISRDEAVIRAYVTDPHCAFRFTANGFGEMFRALREVSGPEWAVAIPKELPILMISGDADPVGDYGRGVARVRDMLRGAGVKNLECRLYPGARHEVLNETNNQEVYEDVLAFLQKWWRDDTAAK